MVGRLLFRALLLLYPPWFRDRFGSEMTAEFEASRDRCTGPWAVAAFWLRIVWDSLKTFMRAWWHAATAAPSPMNPRNRDRTMPDHLLKDIRLAFRGVVRRPGPALIAVLALGLGIGLTAGMFSIVNGVILKGLPVEDSHELVAINRINPSEGQSRLLMRIHDFVDLQERQTTLEGLGAYEVTAYNLASDDGLPDFVQGANVTAGTFELLRTTPIMGRKFAPEDAITGAPPVALIGYRFWQDRFGGTPDVIGRTVRLDGRTTEIIGIMPDGFEFPFNMQLWRPLPLDNLSPDRGIGPALLAFGRLPEDVPTQLAQEDLGRVMGQLGIEHPVTNDGMTVLIGPYVSELIGYQIPGLLFTMLGAVSLVLLIACANVANLMLSRASLRTKEVALKTALGAGRSRVLFQQMADATVIAVLGGVLGLGVAQISIEAFNRALQSFPQGVPWWFSIELDPMVLLFVLLLTVGASVLSGLVPAIRGSQANVNEVLKDSARGSSSLRIGRLSRGLVVAEVAFSFALLVSAGLMVKSVTNLANVDYPFEGENVFIATLSLPAADYTTGEAQLQFFDQLKGRLAAESSVISSSITTELPAIGFGNGRFELESETYVGDSDYPSARIGSIDADYFEVVSTTMVEGRAFEPSDDDRSTPVTIVNQKFVDTYYPGESVIGRRLRLRRTAQAGEMQERLDWATIVGVAPDFYLEGDVFVLAPEAIYMPLAQRPEAVANLMIHTRGEALDVTARAREIVAELDPDLPISQVNTLTAAVEGGTFFFRIFGVMFTIFGAASLFLASVGLYGVLSFSVNQRKHELGLRVALGSSGPKVARLILGQTGLQLTLGMAAGLGLSLLLGRGLSFVLFDVAATDSVVLAGVAALLTVTTAVACLVPVLRATSVDPIVAMQSD